MWNLQCSSVFKDLIEGSHGRLREVIGVTGDVLCHILRSYNINSIPYEITSLAVHMPIQKHMYISTPLHEEAIIHSLVSWMKCIIVLVIWGACKNNLENLVFGYIFHTHCADG